LATTPARARTLAVATRTLVRVNCRVGEVGSDYSEVFKRGVVMWLKPTPGAVRPNGDTVKLLVSRGRKP
jgi:beta-lactam-binding protein with PASTA domain